MAQGRVLVNIDNPETHQSQYHTADFDRSKWTHWTKHKRFMRYIYRRTQNKMGQKAKKGKEPFY